MAGKTKRALRNTAIQAGTQVITWTLSWVLLVVLPRYLGDSGFGKLFFAISYGTIFSTLINLGMNTYVVREVAVMNPYLEKDRAQTTDEDRLGDLLGNVFALKIILTSYRWRLLGGL